MEHLDSNYMVRCEVTRADDGRVGASLAFDPKTGAVSMGWHERMTQDEFIVAVEGLINQLREHGPSLGFS